MRLAREYWSIAKEHHTSAVDYVSDSIFDRLNDEQRLAFELFSQHLQDTLNPDAEEPEQLLLQVHGQGGTGKSFMINAITICLQQLAGEEVVAKTAPTRVAANAINGATLH